MAQNKVVKCICHAKTFDEIKAYAEKHNISTLEELQERNYCSNGCRMCTPYVEMVLKTGQTEFNPGEPFR
jgi:bacterioferritin-associated ferredoxin